VSHSIFPNSRFADYFFTSSLLLSFFSGIELVPLSAFYDNEEVVVDRPFMFIIRDKAKNVPLFIGKVMDPTRTI
jgi:hypothetical protein